MRCGRSSGAGQARVERGTYRQPNGKYVVCFRLAGRARFRVIAGDLNAAHRERDALVAAAQAGALPVSHEASIRDGGGAAARRFEARSQQASARERTFEGAPLRPRAASAVALGRRLMRTIAVEDVAALLTALHAEGCWEKTVAGALATLHRAVRFALRNGWIVDDPVGRLEAREAAHRRELNSSGRL